MNNPQGRGGLRYC